MSVFDINWSATLVQASGNIEEGYVVCLTPEGDGYVVATSSARAAVGPVGGVALTVGAPSGTIMVQYSGEVPPSITGLGVGAIAAVRIADDGSLERVVGSPAPGDYIMGDCSAIGGLTLQSSSHVNPFIGLGLDFQDEGVLVVTAATTANFVGAGVTVTNVGGVATVTVPGGGSVVSVGGTLPLVSTGGSAPVISINAATDSLPGSLSAADKTKLDGITAGAAVASVGGTLPIVSSGGTAPVISINAATDSLPGSLSAADKTKLDSITSGAAVASVGATAPITTTGGATPNIGISAATPSVRGSMSAADKTKLDAAQFTGLLVDGSPAFLVASTGPSGGNTATIVGGNGSGSTPGGTAAVVAGNGQSGGSVLLQGGLGVTAPGGNVDLITGQGANSGSVAIRTDVSTGDSGDIVIECRAGGVVGGSVQVSAGPSTAGTPGSVTIAGGATNNPGGFGGGAVVESGDGGSGSGGPVVISSGTGATAGGSILIRSGNSAGGDAKSVTLQGGSSNTGAGGKVEVKGGTDAGGVGSVVISGFNSSGAAVLTVDNTFIINAPIVAPASGASAFSVHGVFVQAMADADQTISAARSQNSIFVATDVITGDRTLTITCPPTDGAFKWLDNRCTGGGGLGLLVKFATGATVKIANGTKAIIYGDGTNAQAVHFS